MLINDITDVLIVAVDRVLENEIVRIVVGGLVLEGENVRPAGEGHALTNEEIAENVLKEISLETNAKSEICEIVKYFVS